MADGQEAEDISPTRTPVRPVMKCWTVLFLVFGVSSTADWASAVVPGADLSSETEFHFDLSSRRDELQKEEPAKPVGGTSSFEVEGRTRKGGVLKKMALPFLLLLGLKAGITVPVIFGIVALVAFKGMWSGFTALVVTAALALRGLIPPSKIIQLPPATPHHVHVADYITDYRRDDHIGRVDEGAYHPYNGPNVPSSYLPPNY